MDDFLKQAVQDFVEEFLDKPSMKSIEDSSNGSSGKFSEGIQAIISEAINGRYAKQALGEV